jgi:hypothetical protein
MRQKLRAFLVAAGTILRVAVPSQLMGSTCTPLVRSRSSSASSSLLSKSAQGRLRWRHRDAYVSHRRPDGHAGAILAVIAVRRFSCDRHSPGRRRADPHHPRSAPEQILRRRWHPNTPRAPICAAWIRSRAGRGVRRRVGAHRNVGSLGEHPVRNRLVRERDELAIGRSSSTNSTGGSLGAQASWCPTGRDHGSIRNVASAVESQVRAGRTGL